MKLSLAAATLVVIGLVPASAHADNKAAKFGSGAGSFLYGALGLGLPLLRDGEQGKTHTLRVADSLVTSFILVEGLKRSTHVPRPDAPREHDSFPSEHATLAFSIATMESAYHPKEAPLWYLGAVGISWSRVSENRHRLSDVFAGAALGYGVARLELSSKKGILLSPFVGSGGGFGLMMTKRF